MFIWEISIIIISVCWISELVGQVQQKIKLPSPNKALMIMANLIGWNKRPILKSNQSEVSFLHTNKIAVNSFELFFWTLFVNVLDLPIRDPWPRITMWLQGQLSHLSFWVRSSRCQDPLGLVKCLFLVALQP